MKSGMITGEGVWKDRRASNYTVPLATTDLDWSDLDFGGTPSKWPHRVILFVERCCFPATCRVWVFATPFAGFRKTMPCKDL